MNLFSKIEDLVNALLIRFQELFWTLVQKATPARVKSFIEKFREKKSLFKAWLKTVPGLLKAWISNQLGVLKSIDIKGKLKESYVAALARTKTNDDEVKGKFKLIRKVVMAPVLVVSQWLQGLSVMQSMLLMGFSAASVLAVIGIGFEGQRLAKHMEADRAPASAEVEDEYPRPSYYKKQTRHVEFSGFRLPVYVPEVNELRTVDIDFIATLSTREDKMWLEKREFQLRDHIILNMEPLTASFPLEDEGKEIIRQKLIAELNDYLVENKRESQVIELKLTYVLAN